MPLSSILSTFLDKCKKPIHSIRKLWIWRGGGTSIKNQGNTPLTRTPEVTTRRRIKFCKNRKIQTQDGVTSRVGCTLYVYNNCAKQTCSCAVAQTSKGCVTLQRALWLKVMGLHSDENADTLYMCSLHIQDRSVSRSHWIPFDGIRNAYRAQSLARMSRQERAQQNNTVSRTQRESMLVNNKRNSRLKVDTSTHYDYAPFTALYMYVYMIHHYRK